MSEKTEETGGSNPPQNQLARTVLDAANEIWLAGLGAFAKAQREGTRVFEALVSEGEHMQQRAKTATDQTVADVKARASNSWEKASDRWERLEQVFEERVAQALNSLNVPSKKDIDALSTRVAELTAVVDRLSALAGQSQKPEVGSVGAQKEEPVRADG